MRQNASKKEILPYIPYALWRVADNSAGLFSLLHHERYVIRREKRRDKVKCGEIRYKQRKVSHALN